MPLSKVRNIDGQLAIAVLPAYSVLITGSHDPVGGWAFADCLGSGARFALRRNWKPTRNTKGGHSLQLTTTLACLEFPSHNRPK